MTGVFVTFVAMALLFAAGCGEDDPGVIAAGPGTPTGDLVSSTGCKSLEASGSLDITPITSDCIMHRWDGVGTLRITHVNAGFNCCPGDLSAEITIEDGVILIVEAESEAACRCLCLYDVEYKINDLPPGEYTIRIIELYTEETDEVLEVTVDLRMRPSGIACVDRDYYPWKL